MRGGTSKGVFFKRSDRRVPRSRAGRYSRSQRKLCHWYPDPYGKQITGMGGATSSTSKTVILDKSAAAS